MTGKKLNQLLLELNPSQLKTLQLRCDSSTDKRLAILKVVIDCRLDGLDVLNTVMISEVDKRWPASDVGEKKIKLRRLQNFFAEQIEQLTLLSFLAENSSVRNVLLAQAFEKRGNLSLLNNYFDKAFSKSVEEEDLMYQLMGIRGKIRMRYAAQSDSDMEEALALNETYVQIINHLNEQKIAEYYENLSNIYLERNAVVNDNRERYIQEINSHLSSKMNPLYKASLMVSLAKLNYENDSLFKHFESAKELLYTIADRTNDFYVLERKIRFLELRLNFFLGKDTASLIQLADEILVKNQSFSVINNNTLFYKILAEILSNNLDTAQSLIDESHAYFKGDGKILEEQLQAILYIKLGEDKKALQILQPMMYLSNYFIAIFARLLVLKVQIKRGDGAWNKSLIDSTKRFLQLNAGNPLGKEAHDYVLHLFTQQISKRKSKAEIKKPLLTIMHEYLLEE